MKKIHPTAVIDPLAEIGEGVEIGPYAVVDGPVRLGRGTRLLPHATIMGHTMLGEENVVFPGAVLGAEPQDLKYEGSVTTVEIGDRNKFREHVTVHPGTVQGGGRTIVGSGGLYMVGSHIAHDCIVGDGVILANHVLLAGHVRVHDGAIMNGGSACHHFTTIGRLAYVGGLSTLTHDVHPFTIVEGHPSRTRGANTVGMQRAGLPAESVQNVRRAVYALFLTSKETTEQAIARLEREMPDDALVRELIRSVRAADSGRKGRAAESLRRAT